MKYLDEILMALGSKQPFLKNGELSKSGQKAYDKLIDILYGLESICPKLTLNTIDGIEYDLEMIIKYD